MNVTSEVKELINSLEDAIETICILCKRANPWHKECTSCTQIEGYREDIKMAGGFISND